MHQGRLMRALLIATLGVATLGAAPADDVAMRWLQHVRILASDDYEGRLPGSAGEEKTVRYLVRAFRRLGLQPGGETVDERRSWFQTVPVVETPPPTIRRLSVDGPNGPGAIGAADGLILTGTQSSGRRVDIAAAPLVFVGHGIDAPELGWDDYKGADLTGKIAVILFGDPVGANGERVFPGDTMSAYGAPRVKYRAAARRGAVATLIVHEPRVLGYTWKTTADALGQVRQSLVAASGSPPVPQAQGWLREDLAERLFASAGTSLAARKASAGTRAFRPAPLNGLTLTARLDVVQRRIVTRNVIGLLPGRTRPDETLLIGAHWDHQGTGPSDAAGDRVYNGAIDNATGVATVLEVAHAMTRRGRPERSVAFVGWTMEEPGILGSEYYAAHPIFPLATTVAIVNFDTMIPLGRARDFSQNADPASDLTDLLREAGARQGRTLTIEPHRELFLRVRSDHGPLVRTGVPGLFYMAGEDLVTGGRVRAKAFFDAYFAHDYHQRTDAFSADWDASGIAQDVALVADFAWSLADSRRWPAWKAGAEWKAVRDRSAAARR